MSRTLPKAVIDLGTNTFHLLIYTLTEGQLTPIFRLRKFVKLAEEGIETIGTGAIDRALEATASFRKIMDNHGVREHRAVGTAALRTASNSGDLLAQIRTKHNLNIEVISGDDEARFIASGAMSAMGYYKGSSLIMDIGGGSVEFIFLQGAKVISVTSLPIGVAVLHRQFHHQDPLHPREREALRLFIQGHLRSILSILKELKPGNLVGASGTFDVVADILGFPDGPYHQVSSNKLNDLLRDIIRSTTIERINNPQIPDDRIDMIVVAAVLIEEVLSTHHFSHVGVSKYALKEGLALA